ncbi:arginine N-succinyltransferase [Kordiimonas sp. SCSIO 12610]|uniref:arginine N-succinyltransferase n=1 Tax=Kordiimonas sp. SCSIO 12610 TaxID=2829597 RepID=UPI00210CA6E3|nr:arginine N-succinyltransferase [Kordiimonas sp. SCSIO 12610]UTW55790.1 arginine N-succinyltransferase [Kordiimonas sp. SCSIO 12610]
MFVVRQARSEDLDALMGLAAQTGTGMTTFPADEAVLSKKIADSVEAFASKPQDIENKKTGYLLVLEDLEKNKLIGTSAILTGIGYDKPFYSYRLLHQTQVSQEPAMRVDTELLNLSNDFVGASEIATLFLHPDYRIGQLGKLLAKARYLLIASHPDRFADKMIAEIRGWVDENESSPFWEAIGRQFFCMDFDEADRINGVGNSQFIADLMPKFPIYTALLPESARAVIGKAHDNAAPAKRLLEKEGFHFSGAVDIFDGGPTMEAHKWSIWSVRRSMKDKLGGIVEGNSHEPKHLIAKTDIDDFRVAMTNVVETSSGFWVPSDAAEALQASNGDEMRYVPIERPKPAQN